MALKTAMIDVGGGFRAIFGCGVMDRMLEDGIDVNMCYGVSAGAANMTSFIARQHGRNHILHQVRLPQGVRECGKLLQEPQLCQPRLHLRHAEQSRWRESVGFRGVRGQ